VGLKASDIADDVPIQTVSTGLAFTIVPVKKLETLRNLRLDWGRASEYLQRTDGHFFYFVCSETDDPAARLHARMIFYNGEDPATGSAAGLHIVGGEVRSARVRRAGHHRAGKRVPSSEPYLRAR
jgi:trans-2,3-dihydro-3-hydroxyanthranilate isomerase